MPAKQRRPITLERRQVVADILRQRGDTLVVTGLGSPTYDVAATGDHPHYFYVWGGMGGAAMIGLGLAQAQPARRTLVITGDGEMLMGLGSLATIGAQEPRNLAIAVLDDEHYSETGMQESHTHHGFDLAAVGRAANFKASTTVRSAEELKRWIPKLFRVPGPVLVVIKIIAAQVPRVVPLRDGVHLKNRFREALLGEKAFE
jgi:thiamine pyrophosphate-dependent acetolactate synthase large subunit-like protein